MEGYAAAKARVFAGEGVMVSQTGMTISVVTGQHKDRKLVSFGSESGPARRRLWSLMPDGSCVALKDWWT